MTLLNYEWLGFAATEADARRIIQDTGIFYIAIAMAYLFSFFYMSWYSQSVRKYKKLHYIGISLWALEGMLLVFYPCLVAYIFNYFILLFSLLVLYQLYFTSALVGQSQVKGPEKGPEDKKTQYAQVLIEKANIKLTELVSFSLINEQILWFLIFYRSSIALRASFGL